METQNEKKWFIYLIDHHEGPYSVNEIGKMVHEQKASSAYYIWSEGMPDWEVMSSVDSFRETLKSISAPPPPPSSSPTVEVAEAIDQGEASKSSASEPLLEETKEEVSEVLEPVEELEPVSAIEAEALEVSEPVEVQENLKSGIPTQLNTNDLKIGTGAEQAQTTASYIAPTDTTHPGMKRKRKIFRPFLVLFIFIVGIVVASAQGLLDPIWTHPLVKPYSDKAKPMINQLTQSVGPLYDQSKNWIVDKIPYLQTWVSSLPDVPVSEADKNELKSAMQARFTGQNPALAVAMGVENITSPLFYVTSNLPDKTVVTVWLEGISNTLLNRFEFSTQARVILSQGYGKTTNIVSPNGQPIPKGKYRVIAFVSSRQVKNIQSVVENLPAQSIDIQEISQQTPRVISEKIYFIGGENDESYRSRLSDFQKKVREKAAKELLELRQFVGALQGQLDLSIAKFTNLTKTSKTNASVLNWKKFQSQWAKFNNHMSNQFRSWDSQKILQNVYYSDLYINTRTAGEKVSKVFNLQNSYFNSKDKKLSLANKQALEREASQAELVLQSLKKALQDAGDPNSLSTGLPPQVKVEVGAP